VHAPRTFAARAVRKAPVLVPFADAAVEIESLTREAAAWSAGGEGRVAILQVGPPGVGKTRAVFHQLAADGEGSFLAPRHALTQEHLQSFARLSTIETRYYEGMLRHVEPRKAARLDAFGAWGWSPRAIMKAAEMEIPRGSTGPADGLPWGVHEHLSVLQDREIDDEGTPALRVPVYLDELPPLVTTTSIPLSAFEFICAPHAEPRVHHWSEMHADLASLVVSVAREALSLRLGKSLKDARYPEVICGGALAALARHVVQRTLRPGGGADDFLKGWMFLTALNALSWSRSPITRPPAHAVVDGKLRPGQWLRGDWYDVLAVIARDLYGVTEHPGFTGTTALVVSGHGQNARAEIRLVSPWSDRVRKSLSFVIVDATAGHLTEAITAAWPGWSVRPFALQAAPANPGLIRHLWLVSGGAARSSLMTAGGRVKPRAAATLIRLLLQAGQFTASDDGSRRRLALVAPKAVVGVLRAARHFARKRIDPTGSRANKYRARLHGLPEEGRALVLAFKFLFDVLRVKVLLGHQGAVRGTNRFERCDGIATLPFCPNIGSAALEALALRIPPEGYIQGIARAELEQEWHRLRQVRATTPKVVMHVDSRRPGDEFERWDLPEGSQGAPGAAAKRAAVQMLGLFGATSAMAVRMLAESPRLRDHVMTSLRDKTAIKGVPNSSLVALNRSLKFLRYNPLNPRTLQRAVKEEATRLKAEAVPCTLMGRATEVFEVRPGAAARLAAALGRPRAPASPDAQKEDP